MTSPPAQRVLFYGVTGSGKSSAAHAYAQAAGLPEHSADDDAGWLPGWQNRPEREQRELAASIAAGDRWVIDSAYGFWRDLILDRADLIVALDYPRRVSLGRLIRRTVRRCVTGEPACNGNIETIRRVFTPDSIILWHFRSFASKRASIAAMKADPGMPAVIVFRSPLNLEDWLAEAGKMAFRVDTGPSRNARKPMLP